ncbi:MAG TPA: PQQ-binding-like beta-propeller repeat protein [Jatrophihabitans sp.]|nr:PQQ-binding-like beta-propeller repeat protein [Jatrophihabitans sp.]
MHSFTHLRRGRTRRLLAVALVMPLAGLAAPAAAWASTASPTAASPAAASAHAALAHEEHRSGHPAWTQFQHDAAKTGWNPAEHSLTRRNVGTLTQRWTSVDGLSGSPIVVGERVFVTLDGQLTAFSRDTGRQLWQTALDGDVSIPPGALAYGDG